MMNRYDGDMLDTDSPHAADAWLRDAQACIGRVDAEWLLCHVLDRAPGWLYAHGDSLLSSGDGARFSTLVARRAAGEPVAYLTGMRGFWTFDLVVTPATLIPRADTELLVELALARIPANVASRVADLGTGSGAIALALARERPIAQVWATDASAPALDVARDNARRLDVRNIEFAQRDWLQSFAEHRFDTIVSNPPYIEAADPHLAQGDLRHEPVSALASGVDGLDAIRAIARDAPAHLVAGGWLLLEHGWRQGEAVRGLLDAAGFIDVDTQQDLAHHDRVTSGPQTLIFRVVFACALRIWMPGSEGALR